MKRAEFAFVIAMAAIPVAIGAQPTNPDPYRAAQSKTEPAATGLGFYLENDVIGFSTDQNYTGGFALSSGGRWVAESGLAGPLKLLQRLTFMRRVHNARELQRHGFALVGSGFTPERDELTNTLPVFDDRPYASIFGMQFRQVSVGKVGEVKKERHSVTSELTIGALGLNIVKSVQTDIHRSSRRRSGLSTPVDPLGWHNQISNGGEWTLLYRVAVEHVLRGASRIEPGHQGQLTWLYEGSAGYYNNIAAGLSGRWGRLASQYWEFSSNPLGSIQQKMNASSDRCELYGFFGARARGVAYNALLQGQFRKSAHTFSGKEISRGLLEGEGGVHATLPVGSGNLGITWVAIAGRTAEFKGTKARSHAWGAVHITYSPRVPSLNQ